LQKKCEQEEEKALYNQAGWSVFAQVPAIVRATFYWFEFGSAAVILPADAPAYSLGLPLPVLPLRDRRFRSLAGGTTTGARPVQEEVG
jgi:hypothetical protein